MIKVLMLGNHSSNKGGMTSVINQIKNHDWEKEGIELSFIPTFIPGTAARKILFFAGSYIKIISTFIFSKPDIVHMHMSYKGSFTRKYRIHKLCSFFKVKDIVHLHGSEFEKWYDEVKDIKKIQIRELLSGCKAVIVLGDEWKDIIKKIEPAAKVMVISNGIDIPEERVVWNNERCQILFLGVLIHRKGVSDLIKAISLIKESGKIGNMGFVIAGTGDEEEKLKQQVRDVAVNDYVTFTGWVTGKRKSELIQESQLLVLPSYNEGLPISILEAASYGMPIVATNVGDIPTIVKDGQNGILIKPGDINALAEGIMRTTNKCTFKKMSDISTKIIKESFSIEAFYDKLKNLYMNLFDADVGGY